MTPSEIIQKEADEIVGRTGRYIPPYRMTNLMRTAQKVTELLVKTDICMTYEECEIILDIVKNAISCATGQNRGDEP